MAPQRHPKKTFRSRNREFMPAHGHPQQGSPGQGSRGKRVVETSETLILRREPSAGCPVWCASGGADGKPIFTRTPTSHKLATALSPVHSPKEWINPTAKTLAVAMTLLPSLCLGAV